MTMNPAVAEAIGQLDKVVRRVRYDGATPRSWGRLYKTGLLKALLARAANSEAVDEVASELSLVVAEYFAADPERAEKLEEQGLEGPQLAVSALNAAMPRKLPTDENGLLLIDDEDLEALLDGDRVQWGAEPDQTWIASPRAREASPATVSEDEIEALEREDDELAEVLRIHGDDFPVDEHWRESRRESTQGFVDLLARVGVPEEDQEILIAAKMSHLADETPNWHAVADALGASSWDAARKKVMRARERVIAKIREAFPDALIDDLLTAQGGTP